MSTAYGYGGIAHEFAYDGQGRVTSATDSRGYNLNYTYNPTNTRATMNMVWQGQTVSYAYDENDRLRYIYLSGSPARSWQLQYDDAGRRSKLLHNNGVYSLYNYNSTSKRLYQILHYTSTNSFLDGYSYAYNNAGNITAKTTGTASLTYTYNNNNRLTDSSLTISGNTTYEHFTYDQAGNRLSGPAASTTYSYDDDDRMSTMTGYTGITYDNNGNLTGRTLTSTGEVWTYFYDYENRLVQALKKIGGAVKTDSTFKYDALGRRVYRKVIAYGPPVTEEKEFTYIYDGFDLVQELVTRKLNGATQPFAYSTYVHGPGVDEPLYMNKNVGGVSSDYYFHADALGSVTSLTNSNQVIMEYYRYTSYGEMTRTGSVMNKFLFTGRELDEETGLYYYRVRYLDPKTGRFTTKDPIGFEGGVNKYIYVFDNPVNWVDPWGLEPPSKIPPGVDMKKNIERAKKMSPFDFYRAVKSGGEWDYKKNGEYEDFGNYNYGATGRACGFDEDTLKRAAGAYQWYQGTSNSKFGSPWGGPPYGDDPEDQKWIKEGIDDYDTGYYNKK